MGGMQCSNVSPIHRVNGRQGRHGRARRASEVVAGAGASPSAWAGCIRTTSGVAPMLMPAGFEEYAVAPVGLRPAIDLDEFGACRGYVDRLSLLPDQRRALLEGLSSFDARQGDALRSAMSALHRALSSEALSSSCDPPDNAAYPSIQRRLELAYGRQDGRAPKIDKDALGRERLVTSPPVARTPMAARRWPRGLLGRWLRRFPFPDGPRTRRRTLLRLPRRRYRIHPIPSAGGIGPRDFVALSSRAWSFPRPTLPPTS